MIIPPVHLSNPRVHGVFGGSVETAGIEPAWNSRRPPLPCRTSYRPEDS